MTIEQALNDPGFRSYAQQIGLAGKTGVPRAEAQAAVDEYLARQSEATQQATQVLDSVQPAPQTQAQPQATTQQGLDPMTALRVFVEEDIAPKIGEWRGRYQQIADVAASGGFKSQAERGNRENEIDREIESLITELSLRDYWDPATQEMYKKQVDSGTPRVDAFTRSLDRIIRPSQGGTATAEQTGMTTDDVDKLATTYGAEHPITLRARAKLANQLTNEFDMKALTTPGVVKAAANQAVRLATSEDLDAEGQLQGNLDTVLGASKMGREFDRQAVGVARRVLGDKAPETDDLTTLVSKMNESQSRLYKNELRKNNIPSYSPEVEAIITSGPGAFTNEENLAIVRKAARTGVPLMEISVGEDGKRTVQTVNIAGNKEALTGYMKKFGGAGGGEDAKSYEARTAEMLDSLQKIINDPSQDVLARARAQNEIATIRKNVEKQGTQMRQQESVETAQQERQQKLNEFNELYDLTATTGVFSGVSRNPVLDDRTFEESLSRLEELATQLGGMKDPFISRRIPALQTLRKSLKKPSR